MADETITFELIRKVQLEEQRSPALTKLSTNFFPSVSNYLNQKRLTASDDRKNVLEVRTIERLIEDIFNRRERKILNSVIISARTGLPPENIAEEEKEFYSSMLHLIKTRRKSSLENLLSNQEIKEELKVVFNEDVPEFLGSDMVTYGPFKKGDATKLPEENMKILLDRGVVERA